jgi:ATP synthase F1 delta subunit
VSNKVIAGRYAAALMNLCNNDLGLAKKRFETLGVVLELFSVPDAAKVLRSPVMPADLKLALLNYAVEKAHADVQMANFMKSIVEAARVDCLPAIIQSLGELIDRAEGIARAVVTMAKPMPEAQTQIIKETLEKLTKKKVILTKKEDHKLLGGFVVRLENNLIDMSLRTKLDALTQSAAV